MCEQREWRITSWDDGWDGPPFLQVEYKGGETKTLDITDLYEGYDADTFEVFGGVPEPWKKILNETWDELQAAFGEQYRYKFDSSTNPCRWRPHSELEALYEHAKTHKLANVERYED